MADYLHSEPDLETAFHRYEEERRLSAAPSIGGAQLMEWFERVERYLGLDPVQLNYSMLTRSQRISHENLRTRDKAWLEDAERWFMQQAGVGKHTTSLAHVHPHQIT